MRRKMRVSTERELDFPSNGLILIYVRDSSRHSKVRLQKPSSRAVLRLQSQNMISNVNTVNHVETSLREFRFSEFAMTGQRCAMLAECFNLTREEIEPYRVFLREAWSWKRMVFKPNQEEWDQFQMFASLYVPQQCWRDS